MSARSFRSGERDYADYDSYLRDQGYCPVHMICVDLRHPCVWCDIDQQERDAEREEAIAKDRYYNADGYAVWEDNR
jgi:hypothetical protein